MRRIILIILIVIFALITGACGASGEKETVGDLETVKALVLTDPTALTAFDHRGYTLLHRAALEGRADVVRFLLERGVAVDIKTERGRVRPLHLAAEKGHVETIELLLDNGAELDAVAGAGHLNKRTALTAAVINDHVAAAELLLKRGAEVTPGTRGERDVMIRAAWHRRYELFPLLLKAGANVETRGPRRITPLHVAVRRNVAELIDILVNHGADVNAVAYLDMTPLHYGVHWWSSKPEIIHQIIDLGADVTAQTKEGHTPLHLAARFGFYEAAEALLEKGAPLDILNIDKLSPLGLAYWRGEKRIQRLILSLHTAAQKGTPQEVAALLKRFPQMINSRDPEGKTPLHLAVEKNRPDIVKQLLAAGADVRLESRWKAVHLLHGVIAKVLVPRNGRIKWLTDKKTPLQIAEERRHTRLIRLLKEHAALRGGPRRGL